MDSTQVLVEEPFNQAPASPHLQQSFVQQTHYNVEQVISTSTEHTTQIVDCVLGESRSGGDVQILGHSPRNTSHNSYTIAYKLDVLNWYHENGENKTLTSKHFGVDRKRIRDWTVMEDQLRSTPEASRMRKRNALGKNYSRRLPGSTDLDQAVLNWYKEQRKSGTLVYSRQLRAKALELSPQYGLPDSFKASTQWLQNWKKRHAGELKEWNVVEETIAGEELGSTITLSSDLEEHLRRLEHAGADIAHEQEDMSSLVMVAGPPEVALARLQSEQGSESHAITLTSNSTSEVDATASLDGTNELFSPSQVMDNPNNDQSILDIKIKEQDQWIGIMEQTLESIETEVTKKLEQAKMVLQQLRSGQDWLKEQLITGAVPTTPSSDKRPSSTSLTNSSKRPRNT